VYYSFSELRQSIFKYSDTRNASPTPETELNIVIYWNAFLRHHIHELCTFRQGRFFGLACTKNLQSSSRVYMYCIRADRRNGRCESVTTQNQWQNVKNKMLLVYVLLLLDCFIVFVYYCLVIEGICWCTICALCVLLSCISACMFYRCFMSK